MAEIDRRGNEPTHDPSRVPPLPPRATMLARGLLRHCPRCGGGDLFVSWFTTRERCPSCDLRLDRGEHDFWIGAWMLNLVGVETVFALALVSLGVALWPDVPWRALTWIGVAGMAVLPLLLFPISRTLWLAIDMTFQPDRPGDYGDLTAPPPAPRS